MKRLPQLIPASGIFCFTLSAIGFIWWLVPGIALPNSLGFLVITVGIAAGLIWHRKG